MDKKLRRYSGNLELYFETGMEQMGCIFHDDRGLHGENKQFKSLEWAHFFGKYYEYAIRIFKKDGSIAYEGSLTLDRHKLAKASYSFSFLPEEMPAHEWVEFCDQEHRAVLYTNDVTLAEVQTYDIKHQIGSQVTDLLTNTKVFVLNVNLLEDKKFTYLVGSEFEDGIRTPNQLEAIDWRKQFFGDNN